MFSQKQKLEGFFCFIDSGIPDFATHGVGLWGYERCKKKFFDTIHAIWSYNERWDFPRAGSSLFLNEMKGTYMNNKKNSGCFRPFFIVQFAHFQKFQSWKKDLAVL